MISESSSPAGSDVRDRIACAQHAVEVNGARDKHIGTKETTASSTRSQHPNPQQLSFTPLTPTPQPLSFTAGHLTGAADNTRVKVRGDGAGLLAGAESADLCASQTKRVLQQGERGDWAKTAEPISA
jgi:hypothetical protein